MKNKVMLQFKRSMKNGNEESIIREMKFYFKELSQKQLDILLRDKEPLNPEYVYGDVFVVDIGKLQNFEISALELAPGARILEHEHLNNNEYYIIWKGEDPKPCLIGESHELINNTDEVMYVLSIKIN